MTYEELEKFHAKANHNRKLITGRTTGCGNCVGYCEYEEHPGYLNTALRKEHNCVKKGCNYYIPKRKQASAELPDNPFAAILEQMKERSKAAMA